MAAQGPSRQELIRRRRGNGFVGRQGEIAAFKEILKQAPEEAAQFLFHIHGPAGVGKSTLVRQLSGIARDAQAITAYVDESVADVVETMEAISAQIAQQGAALKDFDKLLALYRQRRHEADAGVGAATAPAGGVAGSPDGAVGAASPSSVIASQIGLMGLGMIPGVGAFTSAVDPQQVAAGADRVKALLSTRLRSHNDVQLVLSPLQVLTPVFLQDLADAARRKPWLVLFFDTYERTGPMLDTWLRDILVTDRYGELPGNVLVVLAGQPRLDSRCWQDWVDLVTDWPLQAFTDAEARQLLAAKGVTDIRVVEVILQLSERLPVLVSTLGESRPASVEEIGDPSGTAVERFLKWEHDPARRAAALACALPLELDEDVYRDVVEEEAADLFSWLRSMPFVTDHAGQCRYHDVVRSAMLRLQRRQSPMSWQQKHTQLAECFKKRRERMEEGVAPLNGWWDKEEWRSNRLQETYHRLCGDPHMGLPAAVRELLDAQDHDTNTLRRSAEMLGRAGRDAEAPVLTNWGQQLLIALEDEPPGGVAALTVILTRGGLDSEGLSLAYTLRGREYRNAGHYEKALSDYTRAIALDEGAQRAYYARGLTYRLMGRYNDALVDLTKATELVPSDSSSFSERGASYQGMGRFEEALMDFGKAIELSPREAWNFTSRGRCFHLAGRLEEALDDFSRAIELSHDDAWAISNRGRTLHLMERYDEALSDLTRAIEIEPHFAWFLAGRAWFLQSVGRYEEAVADCTRAIDQEPEYQWAISLRGYVYQLMGRYEDSLPDLNRAVELSPGDTWPISLRSKAYGELGRYDEALVELGRAIELSPDDASLLESRAHHYQMAGRYEEALVELGRAIELNPDDASLLASRAYVYRLLGRQEAALGEFTRALEAKPDLVSSITHRGVIYRLLGRYTECLNELNRALELSPDSAWANYEIGVAMCAMGSPEYVRFLKHSIAVLTPDQGGELPRVPADFGNLFLAHCALGEWEIAGECFVRFKASNPSCSQVAEMRTALINLANANPSVATQVAPFSSHLESEIR